MSTTVTWDKQWIHFGTGPDIKSDLIEEIMDDFLIDDSLHFVHERMDSQRQNRSGVKSETGGLLGQDNFQLWNESLNLTAWAF